MVTSSRLLTLSPKVEDLFTSLSRVKVFSKTNLSQAYQQVPLEEGSRQYIVINTQKCLIQVYQITLRSQLIRSFQEVLVPQQQLSIDEAMISYKGWLSFLQYLPKKPKKWGMKAWTLADSKQGYTYTCNSTDNNIVSCILSYYD